MSTRRRGRGRGKGKSRGRGKGKNKGRNQGSSLSANSSSSNLESLDTLNITSKKSQQQEPEIFVGLDIGSSFIKIAVVQNNANPNLTKLQELESLFMTESNNASSFHSKINFLADDSGERCIPSVITILDSNHNEILCGSEAVKSSIRNYKNCIYHSKHLISFTQNDTKSIDIGLFQSEYQKWKKIASKFGMHKAIKPPIFDDYDDDENDDEHKKKEEKTIPFLKIEYRIKKNDGNTFKENYIENGFISMVKKIFNVISSQTGSKKINVVSAVPYYYTLQQINNYKSLLFQSGFNPLQIIYDHSASILSLHLDNNLINNNKYVLCIDFGTFYSTFTVIKMYNGFITSCDKQNDSNYYNLTEEVSGIKVDELILKWLIKDFENRNKGCFIEIEDTKCRLKLLKEITRIKQVLSSGSNQVRFDIESLYEGIDYHFNLSKPKFESIIYDILNGITNWIHQQIKQCKIDQSLFHNVIISGGLAQIPRLQILLQNIFGDTLMTKQLNSKGIASHFVNVYGCAVQAVSLSYLYQFQQQIRNGHESLHKIIDIENKNKNKNKNKNRNKNKNKNVNQMIFKERNMFLNKLRNNQISLSAKPLCLYYILGSKRKQFCFIEKNTALPLERNYKIQEDEIKILLNDNKEIEDDLEFDITFTVDIIDENDCKSILDSMEQSLNNICLKSKKKNKTISINVSYDDNNDLNISIGKEKVLFEFDDNESDEDDDDDDDENTESKTDTINENDDTLDID